MKTLKNNPASFHYHTILKDAVINPTKAYFLNSWQCSSPDESGICNSNIKKKI
jgi:hypothetical protein